jgi:PHD/YefM family antitoxin component YafN of YafNO toxin-antitoxin module
MSDAVYTPVADLQANAPALLARLKANHVPVVVTDEGRSEAVLLDMETYVALQSRIGVLESIARGEREFAQGLVVAHDDVMARLDWWKNRK